MSRLDKERAVGVFPNGRGGGTHWLSLRSGRAGTRHLRWSKKSANIYTQSTDASKRPKDPTRYEDRGGVDEVVRGSSLGISPD